MRPDPPIDRHRLILNESFPSRLRMQSHETINTVCLLSCNRTLRKGGRNRSASFQGRERISTGWIGFVRGSINQPRPVHEQRPKLLEKKDLLRQNETAPTFSAVRVLLCSDFYSNSNSNPNINSYTKSKTQSASFRGPLSPSSFSRCWIRCVRVCESTPNALIVDYDNCCVVVIPHGYYGCGL